MSSKIKNQNSKLRASLKISSADGGFTLLELIVTLVVLGVLVMGTIPLTQNAVRRDKELRLRENLRLIRSAIDEFKRDTFGACPQGAIAANNVGQGMGGGVPADPRSRVVVDDCKIFDEKNPDRYPPTLEILVEGVKIKPRGMQLQSGRPFEGKNATELNENKELTKVYLRELPVDPMTGEADWQLRSSYQGKDDDSYEGENVFDVRSSSDGEALNGEKYSDW